MLKTINNGNHNGTYQSEGKGKAVILIHGFAEDHSIWEKQTAFLQMHYHILIPDLPGTGGSALTTPLTIESMADFIYAIMVAEKTSQATVIGHSMGGYVALAFAEKYPHLLEGLGLFSSTGKADTQEKIEARRKSIRMIQDYGSGAFLRQALPTQFADRFKSQQPARLEAFITKASDIPKESLIAYYEAMIQRPDRTAVLKESKVPVLFFIGKDDAAVPLDNIMEQVTLPAIASIHIFEQTGHMGMLELHEESSHILHHFINFCQRTV